MLTRQGRPASKRPLSQTMAIEDRVAAHLRKRGVERADDLAEEIVGIVDSG